MKLKSIVVIFLRGKDTNTTLLKIWISYKLTCLLVKLCK